MLSSVVAHATGLAALGLSLHSAARRCDRALHRGQVLAGILWTLNSALLGAATATALSCVSAARAGTASLVSTCGQRVRACACALFMAMTAAAGLLTWGDGLTLLPVGASVLVTFAAFFLSGTRLRLALLVGALLWTQYVVALRSPEQIGANLLGVAGAAVGLWRARRAGPAGRTEQAEPAQRAAAAWPGASASAVCTQPPPNAR